jgi:signal transduction histidine kinase
LKRICRYFSELCRPKFIKLIKAMKIAGSNSAGATAHNEGCHTLSQQAADTMYILLDTGFHIVSFNPPAMEFAKNELNRPLKTGEYFLDYFLPAQQETFLNHNCNASYELSYLQRNGLTNWYNINIFPISEVDDYIYGILFAVSNINEKKALKTQLMTLKAQEKKNRTKAILKAQEKERNKIGLELHDNVNQILVSARLYIDAIEKEPGIRMDLIAQAKDYIDLAIGEIRSLGKKQAPPPKGFNLKEAVEELLLEMNTRAQTKFSSNMPADLVVDDDLKLNIYRIVQEQIVNILKHADASAADIVICPVDKTIVVRVTDNGKGFDPLLRRKGIGISNMLNRVESYNGDVFIDSHPGEGCRIEIRIPA